VTVMLSIVVTLAKLLTWPVNRTAWSVGELIRAAVCGRTTPLADGAGRVNRRGRRGERRDARQPPAAIKDSGHSHDSYSWDRWKPLTTERTYRH